MLSRTSLKASKSFLPATLYISAVIPHLFYAVLAFVYKMVSWTLTSRTWYSRWNCPNSWDILFNIAGSLSKVCRASWWVAPLSVFLILPGLGSELCHQKTLVRNWHVFMNLYYFKGVDRGLESSKYHES